MPEQSATEQNIAKLFKPDDFQRSCQKVSEVMGLNQKSAEFHQKVTELRSDTVTTPLTQSLYTREYALKSCDQLILYIVNAHLADNTDIQKIGTAIVENNLPRIEKIWQNDNDVAAKDTVLTLLFQLCLYGDEAQQQKATKCILDNFEECLFFASSSPEDTERYGLHRRLIDVFCLMLKSNSVEVRNLNMDKFREFLQQSDNKMHQLMGSVATDLYRLVNTDLNREVAHQTAILYLTGLGINYDALAEWQRSFRKPEDFPKVIEQTCWRAARLESRVPGICKVLYDEFGIANLIRYSEEQLIAQYQLRDRQMPYGIALMTNSDWNRGLEANSTPLEKLNKTLFMNGFALRVYECSGRFSMAKALLSADERYGENKISFMLIGGHGSESSIQLGSLFSSSPSDISHLRVEDLQAIKTKRYFSRLVEMFGPNPDIILISCWTGKEGGFAQTLSEIGSTIGAKVTAPKTETNIESITPIFDEQTRDLIGFIVKYKEDDVAVSYVGGAN